MRARVRVRTHTYTHTHLEDGRSSVVSSQDVLTHCVNTSHNVFAYMYHNV